MRSGINQENMPPQNTQVPPSAPVPPPVNPGNLAPAGPGFQLDSLTKNPKFMDTVKTFAIYGTIFSVVSWLVSMLTYSMRYSGYGYSRSFSFVSLVPTVIYAIIANIIGGIIFYFIFNYIRDFIKGSAFLSKYINSIFTLFWIPTLVWTVIGLVLAILPVLASLFLGFLFIGLIISSVAHLIMYYFYSKAISKKLQNYYPW